MPECSQVQTFIKCNKDNIDKVLDTCKNLFSELGFNKNYLEGWLSQVRWEPCENGFIYSGCNSDWIKLSIFNLDLCVRPIMLGWTSECLQTLTVSWLEIALKFESEQLEDYTTWKFSKQVEQLILYVTSVFAKHFRDSVIFFSDEVEDGKAWKAILEQRDDIWQFDLALVPYSNKKQFIKAPPNFEKQDFKDWFVFKRIERWELKEGN